MRIRNLFILALMAILVSGCGDGDDNDGPVDNSEALAYVNLSEGASWEYDVNTGGLMADGMMEVVAIDSEYVTGIEAYKVEYRQNNLLVATRWYEVQAAGLFLLGEEVQEQTQVVTRSFLTPVEMIRYPLEKENGILVQSYSTTAEMAEGGSETHRFDIQGKEAAPTPDGPYEAIHLLHTRSGDGSATEQYDEYFVPQTGFVQFELPEGFTWSLRSE